MKRFYLVVFICLALPACNSKKQVAQSETTAREKEHRVSYIDTLFYTPASKASLSISISQLCDSLKTIDPMQTKSGNATARAIIKADRLHFEAVCDTIELRAKMKQELIKDYQNTNTQLVERTTTGYSGFRFYTTAIGSLLAGIVVGIILKKFLI